MFKLLFVGLALYGLYKVIVPNKPLHDGSSKPDYIQPKGDIDEFVDYEEVE